MLMEIHHRAQAMATSIKRRPLQELRRTFLQPLACVNAVLQLMMA
jgi:hypothetical protein